MFDSPSNWGLVGLLLAVLIVVRRYQATFVRHSAEGYRSFSIGLSLLALAALARLFHSESMFAGVPFLSDKIFFDLAYWIGVIAGGAMVVNGASDWLPLSRREARSEAAGSSSGDLLKRVQQLIGVENRTEAVLATTLQYMSEYVGADCGAVFRLSRTASRIELAATTHDFPVAPEDFHDVVAACFEGRRPEEKVVDLEKCLSECLPRELGGPAAVVPVEAGGRVVGCFVLWNQDGALDPKDRLEVQLAADIVAHKIDRDQLIAARQADRRRADWFVALESEVTGAEGSSRKVAALYRGLCDAMPLDSLAVTIVPGRGARPIRYSVASGGNVLVEKSLDLPLSGDLLEQVYSEGAIRLYGNLGTDRQPAHREIITHEPVQSIIAVPSRIKDDTLVVLTLASTRASAYDRTSLRVLELLRPLTVASVLADVLEITVRRELARFESLVQIGESARERATAASLLNDLACLAATQTGADAVRVARIDESGLFLGSMALATSPGKSGTVPPDGQMILALMPLHEQAIQSGRISFGCVGGANGLTEMEAHQILGDDVRQAAVIPVAIGGRPIGVITIASEADYPRLTGTASNRLFLSCLSLVAAPLFGAADDGPREVRDQGALERRPALDWSNRLSTFGWDEADTVPHRVESHR